MRTGFTPTETASTRGTRTLMNKQSIQFKSMLNALTWWEEAEVARIAKGEVVRHLQWQGAPCLQSGGFSSPNLGKRKDLDILTMHFLCMKWWTHIHTGQCSYRVHDPWRENKWDRITKCIKYLRRYPRYPVHQVPTINNNWKFHSDCYWWHCYLLVIQHRLP